MRSSSAHPAICSVGLSCLAIFLAGCGSGSGGDDPDKVQEGRKGTLAPTVAPTAVPTLAATPEPTTVQTPAPTTIVETPAPTPSTPPVWPGAHTVCEWKNSTDNTLHTEKAGCDDVKKEVVIASIVIDNKPGDSLEADEDCKVAMENFIQSVCDDQNGNVLSQSDTTAMCIVQEWDHGAYKIAKSQASCNISEKKKYLSYNYTTFGTVSYGNDQDCAQAVSGWKEGQETTHGAACNAIANFADAKSFTAMTDGANTFAQDRPVGDHSTPEMLDSRVFLLGVGGLVTGAVALACHAVVKRRSQMREMFPSNAVELSHANADSA